MIESLVIFIIWLHKNEVNVFEKYTNTMKNSSPRGVKRADRSPGCSSCCLSSWAQAA
jgi:hypothetical protein